MTPIGHIGIALPVAHMLKLNLPVVCFCALLPDLVDKPLWALGIGAGHYIGHTLLFVLLAAGLFSLKKRVYGLSALLGGVLHLLLDPIHVVPWFYPFVSYDFPGREFNPSGFFPNLLRALQNNFTLSNVGKELIWVAALSAAALIFSRLSSWLRERRNRRA